MSIYGMRYCMIHWHTPRLLLSAVLVRIRHKKHAMKSLDMTEARQLSAGTSVVSRDFSSQRTGTDAHADDSARSSAQISPDLSHRM